MCSSASKQAVAGRADGFKGLFQVHEDIRGRHAPDRQARWRQQRRTPASSCQTARLSLKLVWTVCVFMIVNVAHACNSSKSRSSSGEPQALALHWTLGINKAGNNDLQKLKRHAESEREREREIDRACALALVRTSLAACTTFQMQNLLTCSTPLLTRASSSTITPGWAILHCP